MNNVASQGGMSCHILLMQSAPSSISNVPETSSQVMRRVYVMARPEKQPARVTAREGKVRRRPEEDADSRRTALKLGGRSESQKVLIDSS